MYKGDLIMDELWIVKFCLMMRDVGHCTPSLDGELFVRGADIFDVLDKAKNKLNTFGFDHVIVHGANCYSFKRNNEKEND